MGRPVVMMASADEGRAARPGRRQNLENLQPHAPLGTMRERSGESGPLHCTARK